MSEVHRCLIVDTGTTGLEDSAAVIEIGAVLYSVDSQCVLQELATLLPAEENPAESINRIKPDALREIALTGTSFALEMLFAMSKEAALEDAAGLSFPVRQLNQ